MNKIVKIVAIIVFIITALVIFVLTNLDRTVQGAVESVGSEMTQSKVSLRRVDLSLTSAKGSFQGLLVANPAGFASPYAFSLGEISFVMEADSLAGDTIVIQTLQIVAPEVTLERASGRSNLDQIKANIAEYLGPDSSGSDTEKSTKKLIIQDLIITQGVLHYAILGGEGVDLALPDLSLKNIGNQDGDASGASAAEVASQVVGAIVNAAGKAAAQSAAVKQLGGKVEDQVNDKTGKLKGFFDKLTKPDQ